MKNQIYFKSIPLIILDWSLDTARHFSFLLFQNLFRLSLLLPYGSNNPHAIAACLASEQHSIKLLQ